MFWAFFVFLLADIASWYLYKKEKNKLFLVFGVVLIVMCVISLVFAFIFSLIGNFSA